MKYRKIGGLEVSAIGLGCMGMSHAYGEKTDKKEGAALDVMKMSDVFGGTKR